MKTRSQSIVESSSTQNNIAPYRHVFRLPIPLINQTTKYILVSTKHIGIVTRSQSHTLHKSAISTSGSLFQNNVMYPSRYSERLRRRNEVYALDIDFDEASRAWLKNKTPVGNGCYIYTKNT
jgi:hypothetical protein